MKKLFMLSLMLVMAYLGLHVYFLWQPAGKPNSFNSKVIELNVTGVKVFPAIQAYSMNHIAGRSEILNGNPIKSLHLKGRLSTPIEKKYPITFREEEINAWLSKRLDVKQGGALAPFVKARGVWVDFKKDQIELILERELPGEVIHVTSLFMQFNREASGFVIDRNAAQIGQVRVPRGFSRLVLPAFNNLAEELADELQVWNDKKIHDVIVEDGKITIDPRLLQERK